MATQLVTKTFPSLLKQLKNWTTKRGFFLVLCDETIVSIVAQRAISTRQKVLKFYPTEDAWNSILERESQLSMFGEEPVFYLILLPEKLSKKDWTENSKILAKLSTFENMNGIVLGNTSLRSHFKDSKEISEFLDAIIVYSPLLSEHLLSYQELVALVLPSMDTHQRAKLAQNLHDYCGPDFLGAYSVLQRMDALNCDFQEAKLQDTHFDGSAILDALATGNETFVMQRLLQYFDANHDFQDFLLQLAYFLKQLLKTLSGLDTHPNIKHVFQEIGIPYPAQARLEKARHAIPFEKITQFFEEYPEMESRLRLGTANESVFSLWIKEIFF